MSNANGFLGGFPTFLPRSHPVHPPPAHRSLVLFVGSPPSHCATMSSTLMHIKVLRQNQTIFIISEPSDSFGRIRSKVRRDYHLHLNGTRPAPLAPS